MDLGLDGRAALVMGAGGGLGGAIALALAAEGVRLALADGDHAALARTAESLAPFGAENVRPSAARRGPAGNDRPQSGCPQSERPDRRCPKQI
jgi:3-oxoacyl-[acyl-carrier protein] reductase